MVSVDIVCANFNNGPYLRDFFDSVINSTARPRKLIFVDDCSSDDSVDICAEYSQVLPELYVIKLSENIGFANALNIGLACTEAKYILRIDPDDVLASGRIELQYDYMEGHPYVDVVGSQAIYFHSDSNKELNRTRMPIDANGIRDAYLKCDNGVLHGTTFIRKDSLGELVYCQQDVPSEDYSFFGRLISSGAVFWNINEPLTLVRVHGRSVSNDIKFSTINKLHKLRAEIFGIQQNYFFTISDYISMRNYRRYLFCQSKLKRAYHLAVAALFAPRKSIKRIAEYVK